MGIFRVCVVFLFIQRTGTVFFVRVPSYFDVQSESVVLIDIFCFLRFWDFSGWVPDSFQVPGIRRANFLFPSRCQEVRGRLELLNGSLRAMEEVWTSTCRLGHFSVKFVAVVGPETLAKAGLASSRVVSGCVGKARAPERYPES